MKRLFAVVVVATIACLTTPLATNASIMIDVTEVAGDVVFTVSGTLDTTGASSVRSDGSYGNGLISGGSNWYLAPGSGGSWTSFALTSFDAPFGTSTTFLSPSSSSGDTFFIWGNHGITEQVAVDSGYQSGSAINSGMVFNGTTIADLNLTAGTYHYAIPNDTIVLNIGGNEVPEPGTIIIWSVFAGIGLVAGHRRRKRKEA